MSDMIEINNLKEHPRNREFFDDIYGDRWEDFKQSVVRRGVVEPIVVTQDLLVVSGHQRVRACKEIGLLEIPCRITYYPDYDEKYNRTKDDMILEDLICTNIMQRGVGNVNPMKMAKCIQELERIKGIKVGRNQYDDKETITQKDLANMIGLEERQLRHYKRLNDLIPELQTMVENGSMKATVGYKIWAKMSEEEQEKFLNDIGEEKIKIMTQKDTQEYINKNKRKSISKQVIKSLMVRSNGQCECCGFGGQGLENIMNIHHIHKYSETQDNSLNNLKLLCPNCHSTIHTLENCSDKDIYNNIINNLKEKDKIINLVEKFN